LETASIPASGEEIKGLDAQVSSKAKQLELIGSELSGARRPPTTTPPTRRKGETARIEGERGRLTSAIAETGSKIGEAQLQIVRLDQDFRTDVKELGENAGQGSRACGARRRHASRSLHAGRQTNHDELPAETHN
jgi:hypothetical protein